MERITFTLIHYWCNFYYASITSNYVSNCVKKNLQLIFFFLNNQFPKLWKNDMSLDLLHCSMNILFVTILLFGFSNWQIIYSFKGAVTIKAWNLLSLFFPLVLCFVGGSTWVLVSSTGKVSDGCRRINDNYNKKRRRWR